MLTFTINNCINKVINQMFPMVVIEPCEDCLGRAADEARDEIEDELNNR